jgi:hypothetical protein
MHAGKSFHPPLVRFLILVKIIFEPSYRYGKSRRRFGDLEIVKGKSKLKDINL